MMRMENGMRGGGLLQGLNKWKLGQSKQKLTATVPMDRQRHGNLGLSPSWIQNRKASPVDKDDDPNSLPDQLSPQWGP